MKKSNHRWSAALVVLGLPAIAVLILVFWLGGGYGTPRQINRDVRVGNISLQGVTRVEAEKRLAGLTPAAAGWSLRFDCDGQTWAPNAADVGVSVDITGTLSEVWRAGQANPLGQLAARLMRRQTPVSVPVRLTLAEPALRTWLIGIAAKVDMAPVDAHFDSHTGEVLPEQAGRRLAIDGTVELVRAALARSGAQRVQLAMTVLAPARNAVELATIGSVELSRFSTFYKTSLVPRATNIALAVAKLDGAVIRPGETFSFNTTVGPRTAEGGYQEALEIVRGEYRPGIGGGVCQVSSTVYNAGLLAGLTVVERTPHSLIPVYVTPGRDATVAYGYLDLKLRNDRTTPVVIVAWTDAGQLTIAFRGRPVAGESYAIEAITLETIPAESRQELDPALAPGEQRPVKQPVDGLEVEVWRTSSGRRVRVSHDVYLPVSGLIKVGPEPTGSTEPTVPPDPAAPSDTLPPATPGGP